MALDVKSSGWLAIYSSKVCYNALAYETIAGRIHIMHYGDLVLSHCHSMVAFSTFSLFTWSSVCSQRFQ